jgi:hypothetical protein
MSEARNLTSGKGESKEGPLDLDIGEDRGTGSREDAPCRAGADAIANADMVTGSQ